MLGETKETHAIRIAASAIAGISASVASLPFDNAKTKLQKMTKNADGSVPYKNIFDAMGKVRVCGRRLLQTREFSNYGWG